MEKCLGRLQIVICIYTCQSTQLTCIIKLHIQVYRFKRPIDNYSDGFSCNLDMWKLVLWCYVIFNYSEYCCRLWGVVTKAIMSYWSYWNKSSRRLFYNVHTHYKGNNSYILVYSASVHYKLHTSNCQAPTHLIPLHVWPLWHIHCSLRQMLLSVGSWQRPPCHHICFLSPY